MKKYCVIASANKKKIEEIEAIFKESNFEIVSAADIGEVLEVEENGQSFAENATLKAKAYASLYPDAYILADDSGLCVDALDGRPGIYSARYAGVESDYQVKSEALWKELRESGAEEKDWSAHFACAIAFILPDQEQVEVFEGEMHGRIIPERKGEHGFGYDPIFFLEEYQLTSAEIDPELKNRISHRGRALAKLEKYVKSHLS